MKDIYYNDIMFMLGMGIICYGLMMKWCLRIDGFDMVFVMFFDDFFL